MITVDQILNAKFTPVSKGAYSSEDVDAFLKVVAQSYEESLEENNELVKKIGILADKIESYRNDEEAIKLSLLDAHKMADSITKNANETATSVMTDAETKAKVIVDGANLQSTNMIEEARNKAKEIVDNARTAVASLTARAQAETDQTISAAHKRAAEIVKNAQAKGEAIIGNSRATYEYYSTELDNIKAETKKFKDAVEALCNAELKLVNDFSEDLLGSVTAEPFVPAEIPAAAPVVDEEETEVQAEEIVAEEVIAIEPEVIAEAAADEAVEEIPEEIVEETVEEPAEVAQEIEEVEEPVVETEEAEEEIEEFEEISFDDDLFGGIEDLDIPEISSLDDLVPSLDTSFSDEEDEDITNLFDSLFED